MSSVSAANTTATTRPTSAAIRNRGSTAMPPSFDSVNHSAYAVTVRKTPWAKFSTPISP